MRGNDYITCGINGTWSNDTECYPVGKSKHTQPFKWGFPGGPIFARDGRPGDNMMRSDYMGLVATNPVFGVSDKVILKPVCSAIKTS